MNTYELTLVIDQEPSTEALTAEQVENLGLLATETENDAILAHLSVEATSLSAAIVQGIHNLEQVGAHVLGIASDDLVSTRDIAERTGRTYESVRMLATGKRGPGGFPAPLSTGQWALYSWVEVSAWLIEHFNTEAMVNDYDREIAAADLLIRARHILASDENRDDMARLFVA